MKRVKNGEFSLSEIQINTLFYSFAFLETKIASQLHIIIFTRKKYHAYFSQWRCFVFVNKTRLLIGLIGFC